MPVFLWNTLIVLATVAVMELVAAGTHKYLMHGVLWQVHRTHHRPREGWFEANDLFGAFFAAVSAALFWFGTHGAPVLFWMGIGMAVYGVGYFLVHDVLVHHRAGAIVVPRSGYLRRLYQAHRLHHAVETRDGAVSFGFLYAPAPERLAEGLRRTNAATHEDTSAREARP